MHVSPALRRVAALAAVCVALVAAACGGPAPAPTSAPTAAPTQPAAATPAPTTAPATAAATVAPNAASTVTPAPAAATAPAATKPAAATVAPATGTAPAAAAVPAGSARLTLVPNSSEARYKAREQLAGRSAMSDAVGSTRAVTGAVVVGPNGAIVAGPSKITVDLSTLTSDQDRRDNFIKRNTLRTADYPNAEFVAKEARGLPSPLPTSGQATFQLLGDLTVRGVTRPVTWDVTATFTPQEVTGQAKTTFTFADFEIEKPVVALILSIEDQVGLELDFRAARAAA
jgi:polyisoprenoid-binding protein YceI